MSTMVLPKGTHIHRFRQIAEVLAHHGLGYLHGALGLERFVHFPKGLLNPGSEKPSPPERLRMALEELGTTFIKLGQLLSTRADLLPPEYLTELAKLQDSAPPVSIEEIQELLVTELGGPIEAFFSSFDLEPLAAASIGQVHAAAMPGGADVVIKVRRPGVVEQVKEDLEILHNLAAAASRRWEFADRYDVVGLAEEFAQTIRAELDYLHEARSAERFAANFARDPSVHIPHVYWETTTSRVLTLERIRGVKISDLQSLDANRIDRPALARRGTEVILKMVFEDGFFHADLHPGNFFIEPDGRFGLIDFGMTGTVDERTQDTLAGLILTITSQDYDQLVEVLLDLGLSKRRIDRHQLRRDLEHLITPYYGQPLGEVALAPLLNDAFAIIRHHHLHLPPNLALLVKTIILTEGLGAQLDPAFRLTTVIEPYTERLMLHQYSPSRWVRKLGQASLEMARLGIEVPQQLRRVMGEIERGGLEIGMRPESFEPLIKRLERLANRLVLAVIAAAFIIGLAVLLSFYHPQGWERWTGAMLAVGFLFAAALGIYLAWSIIRSRHG